MRDHDRLYLRHMGDHARKACELIAGKRRSDFASDEVLRLALSYLVQIIGEAANHVSESTRQAHPEIPWQDIVGMRHRLVHGYFEVDEDIVWQTVTAELGPLAATLAVFSNHPTGQVSPPSGAARAGGSRNPRD